MTASVATGARTHGRRSARMYRGQGTWMARPARPVPAKRGAMRRAVTPGLAAVAANVVRADSAPSPRLMS